jgi:hypothetical protein
VLYVLLRARAIGSLAPCHAPFSRHVRTSHLAAGMHGVHGDTRVDHYRRRPMQEAVALFSQRTARLPMRLVLTRHARWLVGSLAPCHAPVSRHVHSLHLPAAMHALHGDTQVDHCRRRPMQEAVALFSQPAARLPMRLVLTRHARDRWLVRLVTGDGPQKALIRRSYGFGCALPWFPRVQQHEEGSSCAALGYVRA